MSSIFFHFGSNNHSVKFETLESHVATGDIRVVMTRIEEGFKL
jgi:hypothetical protein